MRKIWEIDRLQDGRSRRGCCLPAMMRKEVNYLGWKRPAKLTQTFD